MPVATLEDRRCILRWRGLKEHVLQALNRLDAQAIERGQCRFIESRRADIPDRLRCVELRATFGLTEFMKLKVGDEPRDRPAPPPVHGQLNFWDRLQEDPY